MGVKKKKNCLVFRLEWKGSSKNESYYLTLFFEFQ